jgi:hypothetical protein
MGKISSEARQQYYERIKEYKQVVEAIVQREASLKKVVNAEPGPAPYKRIAMADERLNLTSYLLLQNELSVSLLGVKHEPFLNDARKSCYQAVIYLEEVVSPYIDAAFTDYSEMLEEIAGYEDEKRYALVRKLGFAIQSVEDAFGANSKWRWSFVDLEGRYATVAKNMIDFKSFVAGMDPRIDGYYARMGHLDLVVDLLTRSADRFREKYELSTLRLDDFKRAIDFLSALRRIHILLGDAEKADLLKKKIEVWKSKMETDEKKQRAQKPVG